MGIFSGIQIYKLILSSVDSSLILHYLLEDIRRNKVLQPFHLEVVMGGCHISDDHHKKHIYTDTS